MALKYMHADYRKNNPRRPVDWRWLLAGHLVETTSGHIPKRCLDESIYRAVEFRRLGRSCDFRRDPLLELAEVAYDAWYLYTDTVDKRIRWELEAYLLTELSAEAISEKLSISPEAIICYEAWFYNVRDRLQAEGYIINHAIAGRGSRGESVYDKDTLIKLLAYSGGPLMLEAVARPVMRHMQPTTHSGLLDTLDEDVRLTRKIKAAMASRLQPLNWETYGVIIDSYTQLLAIDKSSDEGRGGATESTILSNLAGVVRQLDWKRQEITAPMGSVIDPTPAGALRNNGVCLRVRELLMMASNDFPSDALELAASATFVQE